MFFSTTSPINNYYGNEFPPIPEYVNDYDLVVRYPEENTFFEEDTFFADSFTESPISFDEREDPQELPDVSSKSNKSPEQLSNSFCSPFISSFQTPDFFRTYIHPLQKFEEQAQKAILKDYVPLKETPKLKRALTSNSTEFQGESYLEVIDLINSIVKRMLFETMKEVIGEYEGLEYLKEYCEVFPLRMTKHRHDILFIHFLTNQKAFPDLPCSLNSVYRFKLLIEGNNGSYETSLLNSPEEAAFLHIKPSIMLKVERPENYFSTTKTEAFKKFHRVHPGVNREEFYKNPSMLYEGLDFLSSEQAHLNYIPIENHLRVVAKIKTLFFAQLVAIEQTQGINTYNLQKLQDQSESLAKKELEVINEACKAALFMFQKEKNHKSSKVHLPNQLICTVREFQIKDMEEIFFDHLYSNNNKWPNFDIRKLTLSYIENNFSLVLDCKN